MIASRCFSWPGPELRTEQVRVIYPGKSQAPDKVAVYFPSRKLLYGGCMATCFLRASMNPRKCRVPTRPTALYAAFTLRRSRFSMKSTMAAITRLPARSVRTYMEAELAILTHEVRESAMQKAVAEIGKLDVVLGVRSLLRADS